MPGERVSVRLGQQRRDFVRGSAVAVLVPSPHRVAPPCPETGRGCGGCQWQHITPAEQHRLKVTIVIDALRRLARIPDPPVSIGRVGAVPASGYRTTLRLAVDDQGRACFRRRRGHDLVAVDGCVVAHRRLVPLITEARYPGAREVLLRAGARTGDRLVLARTSSPPQGLDADVRVATGPGDRWAEEVAGRRWEMSATSFFQSGPDAADALTEAVDRAVGADLADGGRLIDCYAGVGLLGGVLAARRQGIRLTAVESSGLAAADAAGNLSDLDAQVLHGQVADMGERFGPVDVIVADPARTGLGRSATSVVAGAGAALIVLVSCDPASLARDAGLLRDGGYDLEGVEVLDLFPHTFHVETVARFRRRDSFPRLHR
jgi:23S rRNA (uracil1939-C5)-methyltransferase